MCLIEPKFACGKALIVLLLKLQLGLVVGLRFADDNEGGFPDHGLWYWFTAVFAKVCSILEGTPQLWDAIIWTPWLDRSVAIFICWLGTL